MHFADMKQKQNEISEQLKKKLLYFFMMNIMKQIEIDLLNEIN